MFGEMIPCGSLNRTSIRESAVGPATAALHSGIPGTYAAAEPAKAVFTNSRRLFNGHLDNGKRWQPTIALSNGHRKSINFCHFYCMTRFLPGTGAQGGIR